MFSGNSRTIDCKDKLGIFSSNSESMRKITPKTTETMQVRKEPLPKKQLMYTFACLKLSYWCPIVALFCQ